MMRQRPAGGAGGHGPEARSSQNYYGGYRGSSGDGTYNQQYGNGHSGYSQSHYGGYNAGSAGSSSGYGGYTGSSMNTPSSTKKDSRRNQKAKMGGSTPGLLPVACVIMVIWSMIAIGLWMNVKSKYASILSEFNAPDSKAIVDLYKKLQTDLAVAQQKHTKTVQATTRDMKKKEEDLKIENRRLQKERDELLVKYEGPDNEEKQSRLHIREEAFQKQVKLLQDATRKEARRNVLESFGPGPHEVEFRFRLKEKDRSFVVELAPLDEVPHAIHVFLEQIEHGLWNGCFFYLNGPHVIQAGPQLSEEDEADNEDDEDDRANAMLPFKEAGLDSLAFPDYSDNFPHVTWTLGFTGRPGGPDFYINKLDNSVSHGPGGQIQHVLDEQGDSCFAKITRGQNHAALLFNEPTYNDRSEWHYFLTDPVEILEARILTQHPNEGRVYEDSHTSNDNEKPADPVQVMNDKIKRKPRLPKIDHAVDP